MLVTAGLTAPSQSRRRRASGRRQETRQAISDIAMKLLAAAALRAFDLLEPSLGGYGVRADTDVPAGAPQAPGPARAAPLPD